MINELVKTAKENGLNIYSIAVIDGDGIHTAQLIPANRCNNSYSVAKAFTMTAVGMLRDQKKLDVTDRVFDIMRDEFPDSYDPTWENVTVDDVLKHKAGFECGFLDIDVEDISKYKTDDFLKIVLSRPLPFTPGTRHVYSDAAYYLLSRIVSEVSGTELSDFLRPVLFGILGFQELAWSKCPRGYAMGATGLYISSEDMAKLGYAYANGGEYNGKTVVSEDWIDLSLSREYEFGRYGDAGLYAKGGMNGQMLGFSVKSHASVAWHGYEPEKDVSVILKKFASI
ncbi:MAG: beta-lactamase family protein [Clostridia bacterium]|nr:beta-lactamase family protein [Clostridia bacterium]